MKKMSFKKVMAAVAAMSLAACAAAIPASAASNGVTIAIDQKTMTVEELAAANYTVPIFVRIEENAGVNAVEFGVEVDDRCTFTVVNNPIAAMQQAGEMIAWTMTFETNGQLTWQTWANATVDTTTGFGIVAYMVTVPEAEAVPGAKFDITYVEEASKLNIWNNGIDNVNHVAAGTVDWTDGFIELEGETTTTTEETTTTTEETTTTTEETTTTTEETTTTTTEATTTTAATTTTGGSGSPATADATDILPIVGVAAAAAILGGVAIVSKKKDEE